MNFLKVEFPKFESFLALDFSSDSFNKVGASSFFEMSRHPMVCECVHHRWMGIRRRWICVISFHIWCHKAKLKVCLFGGSKAKTKTAANSVMCYFISDATVLSKGWNIPRSERHTGCYWQSDKRLWQRSTHSEKMCWGIYFQLHVITKTMTCQRLLLFRNGWST